MSNNQIKHVAIVGTGISGLMTALGLSRHGIQATLLERDPAPDDSISPENSWDWARKGVPQAAHSHFFMGRLRVHLEEFHPKLVAALFAAGAGESTFMDYVHPELMHRVEEDESDLRLRTVNCRRTTFEMIVRKYVESLEGISIKSEAKVTNILLSENQPPVVTGVQYESNSDTGTLEADAVVDASGRSSKLSGMLESHGVKFNVDEQGTGLFYFTRHYRLKNGSSDYPDFIGLPGAQFPEFTSGAFPADNGHLTVTVQAFRKDKGLISALRDVDQFQNICEHTQAVARWVDPEKVEPTSKVYGFGQLDSFWRKNVIDGEPQVLNYFFVGDTCVRSNPRYGRGCTWSTLSAHDLADVLATDTSAEERAIRYEQCLEERFRKDWEIMRNMDRGTEQDFEVALGLTPSTFSQRIQQRLKIFMEGAMIMEPALFKEVWACYNGFNSMDAWTRNPTNILRLIRAWFQRKKFKHILDAQQGRMTHADMVGSTANDLAT